MPHGFHVRTKTLALVILLSACSKAQFTGANHRIVTPPIGQPSPDAVANGEKNIRLSCDVQMHEQALQLPAAGLTLNVEGSFCLQSAPQTTVLFVIDMSGSMGRHQSSITGRVERGNDPRRGGGSDGCGRLEAARAVADRLLNEAGPLGQVRAGAVAFAGDELGAQGLPLMDLASFKAALTPETFCSYVVQNRSFGLHPQNPGGVEDSSVDSSTNYQAAFVAAERELRQVSGQKLVYFISDGQPTSGGRDPRAAGAQAGARLRQLPELSLNALLLGGEGEEARSLLATITGSPDRVRIAARAEELAQEILAFPDASVQQAVGEWRLAQQSSRPLQVNLGSSEVRSDGLREVFYKVEPIELTHEMVAAGAAFLDVTGYPNTGESQLRTALRLELTD